MCVCVCVCTCVCVSEGLLSVSFSFFFNECVMVFSGFYQCVNGNFIFCALFSFFFALEAVKQSNPCNPKKNIMEPDTDRCQVRSTNKNDGNTYIWKKRDRARARAHA